MEQQATDLQSLGMSGTIHS